MIMDAAEHVPFYRRHWKQAGVDLTRIYSSVPLEFLPVVTREDLLSCAPEERTDQRYLGLPMRSEPSSTQAGEPFEIPLDDRTRRRRRTRFWNALRDVGYTPGERVMVLSDTPLSPGASLLRWKGVDTSLSDDAMFAEYSKLRPSVLCGPLGSLARLASKLAASSERTWQPRLLVSTADHLTDAKRALLESTFGTRVADFYSTPEHGLVAYAKPGIAGYQQHTNEFCVETLHAAPGKVGPGRLIVTDLMSAPMPLIRFETGDFALRGLTSFTHREAVRLDRKAKALVPQPERTRAVTGLGEPSLPDVFAPGSV
jgi:phenylacetate-CoA ligase